MLYPPSPKTSALNLHVAIVYRLERMGGVQSCVFALMRGLNRLGIVPDVLWDTPPDPHLLEQAQVRAGFREINFTFPSHLVDRMPYTLRYLAQVFNTVDGDSLKAEYDFFYLFYNGFLLPSEVPHLRYLSGPPVISVLQTTRPGIQGLPLRSFMALYHKLLAQRWPAYEYHKTSPYVINARFTADLFEKEHGVSLPVINPPVVTRVSGFDLSDWPQRDSMTFFSRIIDYKRPDWVLRLAQRYPNLRCVIMGGVPQHRQPYFKSLRNTASQMGLQNVQLIANPSNAQVDAELARTQFYVFPARNEHFGMTTVEAITAGALPYVHDSGGQREIVPDGSLRFTDEDFFEKFERITCLSEAEINLKRQELYHHIQQFSEETYLQKMLAYLPVEVQS